MIVVKGTQSTMLTKDGFGSIVLLETTNCTLLQIFRGTFEHATCARTDVFIFFPVSFIFRSYGCNPPTVAINVLR
jgi:hypothetical protein